MPRCPSACCIGICLCQNDTNPLSTSQGPIVISQQPAGGSREIMEMAMTRHNPRHIETIVNDSLEHACDRAIGPLIATSAYTCYSPDGIWEKSVIELKPATKSDIKGKSPAENSTGTNYAADGSYMSSISSEIIQTVSKVARVLSPDLLFAGAVAEVSFKMGMFDASMSPSQDEHSLWKASLTRSTRDVKGDPAWDGVNHDQSAPVRETLSINNHARELSVLNSILLSDKARPTPFPLHAGIRVREADFMDSKVSSRNDRDIYEFKFGARVYGSNEMVEQKSIRRFDREVLSRDSDNSHKNTYTFVRSLETGYSIVAILSKDGCTNPQISYRTREEFGTRIWFDQRLFSGDMSCWKIHLTDHRTEAGHV
ncbi:hypothetical protein V866_006337 [Kwoniella sp. B9012]